MLVTSHLECGGQERVMCLLANYWVNNGREVFLMTLARRTNAVAFPIDKRVKLVSAQDLPSRFPGKVGKIVSFRTHIGKIDPIAIIVFGDITSFVTLIALIGTDYQVIVSERTNMSARKQPFYRYLLRYILYPRAAFLVTQNKEIDELFTRIVSRNKRRVIPNPILGYDDRTTLENTIVLPGKALISMGRLVESKRYDRMIDIYYDLHLVRPEWRLFIIGEGPERKKIEAQVKRLGLEGSVVLLGYEANPTALLKQADIFLFTSQYEGFPNSLCEAMAVGLSVISYDCPSGPSDIIINGKNGMLIPNGNGEVFLTSLIDLIDSPDKRKVFGQEAQKITTLFSMQNVARQWEMLFHSKPISSGKMVNN
ncbi:MAG: hypothetical protein A2268_13275 [Candidatus Raymondbacteria bacterium RifOxyA12_full_50_37]|uniref:Glycosyl transferase family 1 domain-containing protein n=1 Tax=Candidatus Raymondbacteria bacterium RIFOXYD12_FULL_49_13 TaxID=1817890 RepID=A0A1F7F070_UNCRA|nr:MAG: hypothetical protein A2268_13275 [Candidatus Raymondbacteria bacterium RifOxyA12_full_50_37]OGJ93033.1 MAG: hypothetical protein A2248_18410 [Candidatus Raymondbacteria bacterium RIFOXYA2_FULL_49_16]OGJ94866.1 MAG: hypothetical protein A2350_15465 [Candidatus Raymondbacteria bacterium RifOxyB12_full_50_8]OGJ99946.1 MAG: hypothetical protein A2519_00390 [Candidatus Raymondbacteria bacterium RIFOXYD12_FULL_49_13]OGK04137.1 MAG: hypothetical protein A2487_14070 [Candidatus Raymondbacteria 